MSMTVTANDTPIEELLTARDLAVLFSVKERTVARWAREGRIPCVWTPGGQRRFPLSDVVAYLDRNRHSG